VHFNVSSVNSDDVSKSVDEWEVLKLGGIDNKLRVLELFTGIENRWINDFHCGDEHLV